MTADATPMAADKGEENGTMKFQPLFALATEHILSSSAAIGVASAYIGVPDLRFPNATR